MLPVGEARVKIRLLVFLLFALSLFCPAAGAQHVAITFDDLPAHGDLPPGTTRADVAKNILAVLKAHHVKQAYGFVNASKLETVPEDKEVLNLWVAAGYPLGNHGYTHMDVAAHSAEEFEADIAGNEAVLKTFMPSGDWHWFRYPFLREGETPEKYHAVHAYLQQRGYRVAQVTLDIGDWAWQGPYARCMAKKDTESVKWLKESYLDIANEDINLSQKVAHLLLGHDVPHVLLLHVGAFNAVMLPQLLNLLKKKHFRIESLEKVESDPVYKITPEPLTNWEGGLLDQILASRNLDLPPHKQRPMQKLSEICQ
jgi:peptidoglycan/xylan/chitin deacetylase (PgdA/CDA1 family)